MSLTKTLTIFIMLFIVIIPSLFAKTMKKIEGEATYSWGDNETALQAKKRCKTEAKRNAVESFATYIESDTRVENYVLTKDVIISKSLGLIKDVDIVDEKIDYGKRVIFYKISAKIDEDKALERLKRKATGGSISDIKSSGDYYFGEGKHARKRKADKKAIENLITNIADDIQNKYTDILPEDEDLYDFTESIINTYSTAFDNCKKKIDGKTTLRYIRKDQLLELFKPRIKKINNYINMAVAAESELRIGDALKYYYWALALLRSHPEHNKLTSEKHFDNQLLSLSLTDKLKQIFLNISVEVSRVSKEKNGTKMIYLNFLYDNTEVNNIGFSYFQNGDWSALIDARNGLAICEFSKNEAAELKKIRMNFEYRYENAAKIDLELKSVIENVSNLYLSSSELDVRLDKKYKAPEKSQSPIVKLSDMIQKSSKNGTVKGKQYKEISLKIKAKCSEIVTEIVKAIDNKSSNEEKYKAVKKYFTKDGYDEFIKIISYGNAKLLSNDLNLKVTQINDEVVVRSVPIQFEFKTNDFKTTERVVFTFDKSTKISHISYALSSLAIQDLMSKPEEFATFNEKIQIIQFMEYYKTAYCLKEYNYIDKIFAENALIIIGKVLKLDPAVDLGEMYDKLGKEKVKYIKMKKSKYMEHLKIVFNSKEYINIKFQDSNVRKVVGKDSVFGIQIKQNYFSSNYADEGYLFLMIDLENTKEPKIYVRSWQPEKNNDGSVIGLSDFEF